ncbi:MAG TPA: hypothetical protein PKA10_17675 [Selenomonadales bacterium]|nr:hypothetical protein [Selenomonadales bacterium]
MRKRISIKFCGGCNPRIDRGSVAEEIKRYGLENGIEILYNSLDADLIIFLSGCSANCAGHYCKSDKPCVVIAANSIDAIAVREDDLGTQAVKKVRDYFERLEKRPPR